jgi:hypothetical protein
MVGKLVDHIEVKAQQNRETFLNQVVGGRAERGAPVAVYQLAMSFMALPSV